jgi:DNA-binding LacI/PurR family transcriptional regulator
MSLMAAKSSSHANITDVAKLAGVSTATVSRVLNGSGYLSDKSRAAVEAAIATLNYTPSQVARSLREQRSPIIGLIVTDIKNPYYPELVSGIESQLRERGYSLLLCNTNDDPELEKNYLDLLISQRADGIIICSQGLVNRHEKQLKSISSHIVLVDVGKSNTSFSVVTSSGIEGGELVGKHLAECGYPKIVYLGLESEIEDGLPRYEGLKQGCGKIPTLNFTGATDGELATTVVDEVLSKVPIPFAIFAHNDMSAIGIMHALKSKGLRVPEDVGVVGYDDIAISTFVTPALTTIKHNHNDLGFEAVQILENLIEGKKGIKNRKVDVELIVRNSTTKISTK